MSECRHCGKALPPQNGRGRRREWCDNNCRRRENYTNVCECGNTIYDSSGNPDTVCGECKYDARYGERNKLLVEMWEAGEPTWYIAERLGMSPGNVTSWINGQRLRKGRDLPLRRARDRDRWDEIEALWPQGLTHREIGERIGMSAKDVGSRVQAMRRAGIDLPRRQEAA